MPQPFTDKNTMYSTIKIQCTASLLFVASVLVVAHKAA